MVIDEAHSSQTGEAAKDLRLALGAAEEQELTAAEAEDAGLLSTAIDPVDLSGHSGNPKYVALLAPYAVDRTLGYR